MTKQILFVCRGNIHRSRIAEAILNSREIKGCQANSCGVAADNETNDIWKIARKVLNDKKILIYTSKHRTQVNQKLLDNSSIVVALSDDVYGDLVSKFKIHGLIRWNIIDVDNRIDIYNAEDEELIQTELQVFEEIDKAISGLLMSL